MTSATRVMLCDDSAVMRRLIKTALSGEASLEVVAEAANGAEVLKALADARPDVLIMDVEMPVMDGIDCVREIRKRGDSLPIIMFSALTTRGAEATFDAIEAGANDFAAKPASTGHITKAMSYVRECLVGKIHQWSGRTGAATGGNLVPVQERVAGSPPSQAWPPAAGAEPLDQPMENIAAVAVGVSTGGPQALAKLIEGLPVSFSVPLVIVQHMPPVFTKLLAQRLGSLKGHQVREAGNGEELRAGEILIAPGDHHLLVVKDGQVVRTALSKEPPENFCRPAVDPLFRSMAECYGNRCIGVVLTGMGKDGANGARALRNKGARVYVQDEASSVVWGMPGNIAECGLADRVLPVEQIASELNRLTDRKHASVI